MTKFTKLTCTQFTPCPKPIKVEKVKKTKINPVSKKRGIENKAYTTLRKIFLEGKQCQVEKCNNQATTVHHKAGRRGKMLCDIRYWLACCMDCHTMIENHPEFAYEKGYSLLRNAKNEEL